MGAVGTATLDFGPTNVPPRDALLRWWFPETAAQWTTLLDGTGLANPSHLHLCQETSGNILDKIGAIDGEVLSANYNQSITGVSRKGLGNTQIRMNDASILTTSVLLVQAWHFTANAAFAAGLSILGSVGSWGPEVDVGLQQPHPRFVTRSTGADFQPDGTRDMLVAVKHDLRYSNLSNGKTACSYWRGSDKRSSVTLPTVAYLPPAGTTHHYFAATQLTGAPALLSYSASFRNAAAEIEDADVLTILDRIKNGPSKLYKGSNQTRVTVTGQTGITTSSHIDAWIQGGDSTASHNEYEHAHVPMKFRAENIVNGVGFDLVATSKTRLTGTFKVHWTWN